MRRGLSAFNITAVTLGLAFLYLPIVILVIYSFNDSRLVTVWGGWSLRWYIALFNDSAMLSAAWTSLRIAFLSATAATVLGTLAAVVLVRAGRFRGNARYRRLRWQRRCIGTVRRHRKQRKPGRQRINWQQWNQRRRLAVATDHR